MMDIQYIDFTKHKLPFVMQQSGYKFNRAVCEDTWT